MSLLTLFAYWLGDPAAIEAFAASGWSLAIGFLLVASASLSRLYDRANLARQPWRLAVPFAASGGFAALLWTALATPPFRGSWDFAEFAWGFLAFLSLFWLTAPLAWLYSLPFERFARSEVAAVKARLGCFALVAAWRVLLASWAAAVLLGIGLWRAFCPTVFLSSSALLAGAYIAQRRHFFMIGGMSKAPVSAATETAANANMLAGCLGAVAWLLSGLACLGAMAAPVFGGLVASLPSIEPGPAPDWTLWALCAGGIAFWLPLLPRAQRRLRLKTAIEDLFARNPEAALREMAQCEASDFPLGWEPPPDPGRAIGEPAQVRVFEIFELVARLAPSLPEWLLEKYREKFLRVFESLYGAKGFHLLPFFFSPYRNLANIHERFRSLLEPLLGGENAETRRLQMDEALEMFRRWEEDGEENESP